MMPAVRRFAAPLRARPVHRLESTRRATVTSDDMPDVLPTFCRRPADTPFQPSGDAA